MVETEMSYLLWLLRLRCQAPTGVPPVLEIRRVFVGFVLLSLAWLWNVW